MFSNKFEWNYWGNEWVPCSQCTEVSRQADRYRETKKHKERGSYFSASSWLTLHLFLQFYRQFPSHKQFQEKPICMEMWGKAVCFGVLWVVHPVVLARRSYLPEPSSEWWFWIRFSRRHWSCKLPLRCSLKFVITNEFSVSGRWWFYAIVGLTNAWNSRIINQFQKISYRSLTMLVPSGSTIWAYFPLPMLLPMMTMIIKQHFCVIDYRSDWTGPIALLLPLNY